MRLKLLSGLATIIAMAFLGVSSASASSFEVQVRGHLTRPQIICPDGAMLCGTAYIEGYGDAAYGWFLVASSGPSESCGHRTSLFDYTALVRFTLPDSSQLTLRELGKLCSPGKSFPTGGVNSYGNPRFFDAHWNVVSATGRFGGLTGSGTSGGTFAGAAVNSRYHGTLSVGSNDATVRLSWAIILNGEPGTCEVVGASHVRVLLHGLGTTTAVEFACDQQAAEFIIDAGTYTFEVELVDAAGTVLGLVPVFSSVDVFIGQTYDLGNFQFAFQF